MRIEASFPSFSKYQNTDRSKSPWTSKEIEALKEAGIDVPKLYLPRQPWSAIADTICGLAFGLIMGLGIILLSGAVFGTLPVLLVPCLVLGAASIAIFVIAAVAKEILNRFPKEVAAF